jgi:hypothetical protein
LPELRELSKVMERLGVVSLLVSRRSTDEIAGCYGGKQNTPDKKEK